ncbi:MAG: PIN domain-containing protein [Acidimicrobiales bacterium]
MKVVDASVIVEMVAHDLDPDLLGDEDLAAPHLIDTEVTHVLRGLVLRGSLTKRATQAPGFSHGEDVSGATSLLTADVRLANSPGILCHIQIL